MTDIMTFLRNTQELEQEHLYDLFGNLMKPSSVTYYPQFDSIHELMEAYSKTQWHRVESLVEGNRDPTVKTFRGFLGGVTKKVHTMFLPDEAQLYFRSPDPGKKSALCELVVLNPEMKWLEVEYSTIKTGGSIDKDREIIWQAFVGPELPMAKRVSNEFHGTKISVREAKLTNFRWARAYFNQKGIK